MEKITFRKLRNMVGSTEGQSLPTVKALRKTSETVIVSAVAADSSLTVYESGFYTYTTPSGTTVYAVDRCAEYVYDGGEVLDMAKFDDVDWSVRLVLAGEDRLEHNNNAREQGNHYSYSADAIEGTDLRDPHDFVADIESRETMAEMLGCLTEKQRQVVRMCFQEGMTQQEMANALGMRQQSLFDHIQAIKKKLKSFF